MTNRRFLIAFILLFALFAVYPNNTFSKGGGKGGGKGRTYSHKGGHYSRAGSRAYKKYYSSPIVYHSSVQRDSNGKILRSESAKEQFLKSYGYKDVPHGYQVDHIIPLYAGGCDCPSNMQLLTIQAHHAKTKSDYQKYGR